MKISVFGNPIVEKDSILIKLLPILKKQFPQHEFILQDPTEDLDIPKKEWWIMDVVEDIDKITILDDPAILVRNKGIGVHDYDLTHEILLRRKIGTLPKIKIIAIPSNFDPRLSVKSFLARLKDIFNRCG